MKAAVTTIATIIGIGLSSVSNAAQADDQPKPTRTERIKALVVVAAAHSKSALHGTVKYGTYPLFLLGGWSVGHVVGPIAGAAVGDQAWHAVWVKPVPVVTKAEAKK